MSGQPEIICYCGAVIEAQGDGWLHVSTKSKWCYESESDLDESARCDAYPDPDAPTGVEER